MRTFTSLALSAMTTCVATAALAIGPHAQKPASAPVAAVGSTAAPSAAPQGGWQSAAQATALAATVPGSAGANTDWPLLGRTADMQHNSPLNQIDDKNVKGLGLAWYADIPSVDGLVGNPLVADGVVYQSGPMGRVYANDVRTGKLLWRFAADTSYEGSSLASVWSLRYSRGLALLGDKVIVATGDCRLIAIDRKSGQKVWESVSCERTGMYGITGAPRVGNGMVFIGNNCIDSGAERGFVDAFDGATGQRKWRFYTVPDDPAKGKQETEVLEMAAKTWGTDWYAKSRGCGSVWDAITYDEKLNLLYIGTAGPSPWNPKQRPVDAGDELFTNSIVAIDATSGKYVWHYKTTPNDGWNFDATMHIMVADLPMPQGKRRVVMTAPKNGFFYVLDAKTGKFLSANNFTPVNWASHIDPATGRPVTIPDARYWERPDGKTIASPGPLGAHNWQAMAYSEKTGLVYIPVIVSPTLMEANPRAQVGGMMFDMYYGSGNDPKWKAYGELVGWDPVAQKARWRVRLRMPMNGGVLTTAGNLVFHGTADGKFTAYASDTGKVLWTYDAKGSIQAAPTTVEVDGQQVLLVAAGNAGSAAVGTYLARYTSTPQVRSPSRLLAFKLGGKEQLPLHQVAEVPKPPLPRPPAAVARKGEGLFEQNFCVDCHGLRAESARGAIPDLRFASKQTHELFAGIVIGGLRKDKGMPAFQDISIEDVNAIQAYLLKEAWDAYAADQMTKSKGGAAKAAKKAAP
jgi:PQQ-dependent dehydrogenase (methanol/ethanol family)